MIKKWILKYDLKNIEFDSIKEASLTFKLLLKDFANKNQEVISLNSCFPFSMFSFFSSKSDSGAITEEEIRIAKLSETILKSLFYKEIDLNLIDTFTYQGFDDYGTRVKISFIKTDKEFIFKYRSNCKGTISYLETNVFKIEDNKSDYFYFDFYETVTTGSTSEKLNRAIKEKIELKSQI